MERELPTKGPRFFHCPLSCDITGSTSRRCHGHHVYSRPGFQSRTRTQRLRTSVILGLTPKDRSAELCQEECQEKQDTHLEGYRPPFLPVTRFGGAPRFVEASSQNMVEEPHGSHPGGRRPHRLPSFEAALADPLCTARVACGTSSRRSARLTPLPRTGAASRSRGIPFEDGELVRRGPAAGRGGAPRPPPWRGVRACLTTPSASGGSGEGCLHARRPSPLRTRAHNVTGVGGWAARPA